MKALVSLGSNLGKRKNFLSLALQELCKFPSTTLIAKSSILETNPVDVPKEFENLKFLNQLLVFETALSPEDFSKRMHAIEDKLGRKRSVKNAPRTIDIDLLEFENETRDTKELVLPHVRALKRDFITQLRVEISQFL